MERRKPLKADPAKARAWQQRSQGLQRGKGPTRQTRLKPRSAKRSAVMVARRELVAQMLAEHPRCQARVLCRGARAVDVHERLTRARGGNILDPVQAHMMTVCRRCHDWVGENVAEAQAIGLLLPSWHRCDPAGRCQTPHAWNGLSDSPRAGTP